jgi:GNAT superfamily N-acetyltransferase
MTTRLPLDLEGIRYSVCDQSEVPEMGRVLARTFTRNDPPAVAVGLTADEFEAFVRIVARSAGSGGLTIVARHIDSGLMAGAILTEDAAAPGIGGTDELSEKFGPIFDLFARLDAQIGQEGAMAPGEALHLFLLGVDDRFARRGIGQQLVLACLANGADLGYRLAVTEATNRVSQHIFGMLGFVARAKVGYADYRRDGIAVFESIAEHGGPMAMIRDVARD